MKLIVKLLPLIIITSWFTWNWVSAQEVKKILPELKLKGAQLTDVRTPDEFKEDGVPGTKNIPLSDLEDNLSLFDKSKPVVVCCRSGNRSGKAKDLLEKNGFKEVYNAGSCQNLK